MVLALVLIASVVGIALIPGLSAKVSEALHNMNAGFVSGTTQPITNAWIEVAVVAATLGFVIWLVEAKTAKHYGYEVAPPPVQSIGVAAPPSFGGSSSFTASSRGGIGVETETSANTGSSSSNSAGSQPRKISETKTTRVTKRGAFGK